MNRTTLVNALKTSSGGAEFITRSQLKQCLACGNSKADQILAGLDHVKFGGDKATKRYDITEVAAKLMKYLNRGN